MFQISQKNRTKPFIPFALLAVVWSVFSPLAPFVRFESHFTYAETAHELPISNAAVYAASADLKKSPTLFPVGYETEGLLKLNDEAGSFTLAVPSIFPAGKEDDLRVAFSVGDRSEVRFLDLEGNELSAEKMGGAAFIPNAFFTEPSVFPPTKTVSYRILSRYPLPEGVKIIATDVRSKTSMFRIDPIPEADAAPGGNRVVKRSDWGADETWRYEDSPIWKPYFDQLATNARKPKSVETLAYEQKIADIETHVKTGFPEQYAAVETIAQENGHTLVWPIEKTKRVEKIVVHHTAENNLKDLSDQELLRSTYRYHAVTRGWGDIGYNFVVGQRGEIYEGRIGGDYVVGAHASWNNRSTVGVSVIGNFEVDHLNGDQKRGLESILETLSGKYGIDYSKTSFSHRECLKSKDCLIEDYEMPNLVGHRDVGYTTCPGQNLYSMLSDLRKSSYSIGLKPVVNPRVFLAASASTPKAVSGTTLPRGPTVRVKLSYPENASITVEGLSAPPHFGAGTLSGTLAKNLPLKIEASVGGNLSLVLSEKKVGTQTVKKSVKLGPVAFFESSVLRVKSWDRKPSWDKTGTMNDNVFRWRLEIRNENGKILLINELPLEDYLKGLGEVSNSDNAEKVKTIVVAARSYSYFYLRKENRKFPSKPYDASDDPEVFQKYLGYGLELRSPNISKLVDATNGEMVTYSGSVVKPWYFNESDGRTRSYKEYCRARVSAGTLAKTTECKDIPYLMGAVDPGGVGHTLKGHGVGISGIGATYFATDLKWKYPEIIGYYLEGAEVRKIY